MATQTFDWFEFQSAMSDFGQYLIELKYVDDAYDFLKSDAQQQPSQLITHTLGTTHPFTIVSSPIPDGLESEADDWPHPGGLTQSQEAARLQELATEAATWGYGCMAELRDLCRLITKPVLSDYDFVTTTLRDLALTLENDNAVAYGKINFGLDGGKWEGNAASAFFGGFVTPFRLVRENHLLGLSQTAACVGAGRAVVLGGQNALMNLVVTMRDAVKDQLAQRAAEQRHGIISADTVTVLSTGMSIVGTLAGLNPATATPGVILGVASTALGYGASKIPSEDQTTRNIEVAEAEEIVKTMTTEVTTIRTTYQKDWGKIGSSAGAVKRAVAADEAVSLLWPPRPGLDGVSPNDFHHDSSEQY